MKKIVSTVLLSVTLTTSTVGCNSQWWQDFQNNPVQYIDGFLTQVSAYLVTAEAIFNAIVPLLTADKQASVQQDFAKAVVGVQHAIQALKDAEAAAAAAQQSKPDLTALVNDVINAVQQVQAIIDEFKTGSTRLGAARDVAGYTDLVATRNALWIHYRH